MTKTKIGILTVSDRASAGVYRAFSGRVIENSLNTYLESPFFEVAEINVICNRCVKLQVILNQNDLYTLKLQQK